ncbi:ABC transporter type 1, transmembrane domain-containing protein [Phlyctochytrium arcticum]|nr:ABC transporter type 1, transmembrane domain-containing protein [Phlyctochytrium arcticum]
MEWNTDKLCAGEPWGPWTPSGDDFTDCFERVVLISLVPTILLWTFGTYSLLHYIFWRRDNLGPNAYVPVPDAYAADTPDDVPNDSDYGGGDGSYPSAVGDGSGRRHDLWIWILLLILAVVEAGLGFGKWYIESGFEPFKVLEALATGGGWLCSFLLLLAFTITTCPPSRPSLYFPFERAKRKSLRYLLPVWLGFAIVKAIQLRSISLSHEAGHAGQVEVSVVGIQMSLAAILCALGATISGERMLRSRSRRRLTPASTHSGSSARELPISGELTAGLFSKLTFRWFNPLIQKGYRKTLTMDDVPDLIEADKSAHVCQQFMKIRLRHASLPTALFYLVRPLLSVQLIFAIVSALLSFSGPFFLNRILVHVSTPDAPAIQGIGYAVAMLTLTVIQEICDGQLYFIGRRIGMRVRAVIIGQIYSKALFRRSAAQQATTTNAEGSEESTSASTGQVTNLMAVDAQKILEVSSYLTYYVASPLQIVICIGLLLTVLGWPALAGVAVMLIMTPTGVFIGQLMGKMQKRLIKATDKRMTGMNETLQGIRIIKFFAWEEHYYKLITALRAKELRKLRDYLYAVAANGLVWFAAPIIVSVLTFMTFTLLAGRELTAEIAFTGLALFNALRNPLQVFPEMVVRGVESLVSVRRVEALLAEPELERYQQDSYRDHHVADDADQDVPIGFTGPATFSWQASQNSSSSPTNTSAIRRKEFTLQDIYVKFPVGGLTLLVGTTGCGKTSMINALLGEMNRLSGQAHLPDSRFATVDPKTGLSSSVAYAAQTSWLMNATIRDNILFREPWNATRYNKVVKACALVRDFETLEGGDMTEIGEKGVNVSGGQKARISLARAAYSSAAFVLLDDPLSAVDAPTARHLFEECILGLLHNRTRILVTHAVHLCIPKADHVLVMQQGRILLQGPPGTVLGRGPGKIDLGTFAHHGEDIIAEEDGLPALAEEEIDEPPVVLQDNNTKPLPIPPVSMTESEVARDLALGDAEPSVEDSDNVLPTRQVLRLTQEEGRSSGTVKYAVYETYITAAGSTVFVCCAGVAYLLVQTSSIGQDWWLKQWSSASKASNNGDEKSVYYYLTIYTIIGGISILTLFIRAIVVTIGSLNASRRLHSTLLKRILYAPMRFFDTTPMGRILNRFSRDIQVLDQETIRYAGEFVSHVVSAIAILTVIAIVTPVFLAGVVPIAVLYYSVARLYLRTSRELKRLESVTRSPIYSHFGETIVGASTIRAYGAENRFLQENHARVDTCHRAFIHLWISNRWLSVRIDFIGALVAFTSAMAILATLHWGQGLDAGAAGLSLSYALTFTEALLWCVRLHAATEMAMNSVERIREYLEIEQEAPAKIKEAEPLRDWPSAGRVEFKDLTVRYAPDLTPVLKNVSFTILPGEKVGIVGRTGAGKSTLSLALYRFLEASEGSIYVDGVDISQIGLFDLRSRLTIIPQDPVLFTGTVRSNLDPFHEHSDLELWTALRRAHLLDTSSASHESGTTTAPISVPRPDTPGSTGAGSSVSGSLVLDKSGSLIAPAPLSIPPPPPSYTIPSSSLSRRTSTHSLSSESNNQRPNLRHRGSNASIASSSRGNSGSGISIRLDTVVSEGGSNFSQGQRQLLCLARALLRSCKVIVLDEATASVDHSTDAKIQETIRTEFRGATLLCVAHRLRTVADYDKILVLAAGQVVEFGSPLGLMSKSPSPDAVFQAMCNETGEYSNLLDMAQKADAERKLKQTR